MTATLGALGLGAGGAQQSRKVLSRVFFAGFLERRDHRGCCLDGVSEWRRGRYRRRERLRRGGSAARSCLHRGPPRRRRPVPGSTPWIERRPCRLPALFRPVVETGEGGPGRVRADVGGAGSGAALVLPRSAPRFAARRRCGRGAVLRPDAVSAPGQPVRHVGSGRGVARGLSRSGGAGSEAELSPGTGRALETAAFLNLPSFLAYLLLGLPLVEGVFQLFGRGFGAAESRLVYLVLAAYSRGTTGGDLGAGPAGRLLRPRRHPDAGPDRRPESGDEPHGRTARDALARPPCASATSEFLGASGQPLRFGRGRSRPGCDSRRLDRARGASPGRPKATAESGLADAGFPALHLSTRLLPLCRRRLQPLRARAGRAHPTLRAAVDLHDLRRRLLWASPRSSARRRRRAWISRLRRGAR